MCSRAPTDDAMSAGDIDGANVYLSSPALHRVVRFRGVWPDGSEAGRPNGLEGEKGRRVAASESRPVTYCKEENGVVSAEDGRGPDGPSHSSPLSSTLPRTTTTTVMNFCSG